MAQQIVALIFGLWLSMAFGGRAEEPTAKPPETPKAENPAGSAGAKPAPADPNAKVRQYWRLVENLYKNATEGGEYVPEELAKWAQDDLNKMGAWEYKVVSLEEETDEALETALNKLGADRWECFWGEETVEGRRFFFRRLAWSYLKTLPVGDMLEAVPRAQKDVGKSK